MTTNSLPALSKYIAQAGYCSRRQATELIKTGKVTINGIKVTAPFTPVQPQDVVFVEKTQIAQTKKIYILFNKPKNLICTVSDEKNRKTVSDVFVPFFQERLYPIGRLDRSTTGLLIMTNDGELTQRLSHPKYEVSKTYQVTSKLAIAKNTLETLLAGVPLEDGFMKVDEAFYPTSSKKVATVVIHSGKNHIVRRLFETLSHPDIKLDRTIYAGLTKTGLKTGEWRLLSKEEIATLYQHKEKELAKPKKTRNLKAKKFYARL
ncbi:MAG: rRNA pseudouridine synthase [Candidatus Dependentiae bacterium]|nr:rRNA pseudouridine synthase [Candidatus Dependentiae bacterium]